jgi:hypothetical protein
LAFIQCLLVVAFWTYLSGQSRLIGPGVGCLRFRCGGRDEHAVRKREREGEREKKKLHILVLPNLPF